MVSKDDREMTDREVMELAYNALRLIATGDPDSDWHDAFNYELSVLHERLTQPEQETIKTWRERAEAHPDHEGIVSNEMIRARMQEEIDELRKVIAELQTDAEAWRNFKAKTLLMRAKK